MLKRLENRLKHAVKGRESIIDLVLVALLSDGHVLLEDYPGSGKTTLAKALGDSIIDDVLDDDIPSFRRIQFTPDLLPSDITGVSIFDTATSTFEFRRGPVFAYIVLGDEINRTSPKVQSAMLEAMAEKQVTVDNVSYPLDDLFFVIATQNPLDLTGTYPLPVAQLDRFLFKIRMDYIERDAEIAVLNTRQERASKSMESLPAVNRGEVVEARSIIQQGVYLHPDINACLVDIARAVRAHPQVLQGISTRSLVLMAPALQASALLKGRDFVSDDDVQWLAPYVFCHRMALAPGSGETTQILKEAMAPVLDQLSRKTLRP
ncbi:AAA family ATPase [bacterium]|nr:AAA family ATPase [bacterium]